MILAIGYHTSLRLSEIAYLILAIGGIWLAATQIPQLKFARGRTFLAGIAFAVSGVLLIIVTHWGVFG